MLMAIGENHCFPILTNKFLQKKEIILLTIIKTNNKFIKGTVHETFGFCLYKRSVENIFFLLSTTLSMYFCEIINEFIILLLAASSILGYTQ